MKIASPKPKPTTQTELDRYISEAAAAETAAKANRQRVRRAKAALKAARQAHRRSKKAAQETAKLAKAARKYFHRHEPKLLKTTIPANKRKATKQRAKSTVIAQAATSKSDTSAAV